MGSREQEDASERERKPTVPDTVAQAAARARAALATITAQRVARPPRDTGHSRKRTARGDASLRVLDGT